MQAIITKYLCPTDHRGSRVKASCQAKTMTISWDDALDVEENHRDAALQLADSLHWRDRGTHLESGCLPDGSYCHVLVEPKL